MIVSKKTSRGVTWCYVVKVTILLLFINSLLLWLRGYVIFAKIKKIFFFLSKNTLWEMISNIF